MSMNDLLYIFGDDMFYDTLGDSKGRICFLKEGNYHFADGVTSSVERRDRSIPINNYFADTINPSSEELETITMLYPGFKINEYLSLLQQYMEAYGEAG